MKQHQTYEQVRDGFADLNDPLFGGSLAYITIDTSLSLLLKLLKIRASKDVERASTFAKITALVASVREDAYVYIEKDGDVFKYMTDHRKENIDAFLVEEAHKIAAMIENLTTIVTYSAFLTTEIKGSIKHDFIMINGLLNVAKDDLKSIFKYEVSKIKDDETRDALEALTLNM